MFYILDGHKVVPCNNVLKWEKWLLEANRHVGDNRKKKVRVSTVFLGLDHSSFGGKSPLFFETLVFGGKHDGEIERYSTWEEAEQGHRKMCEKVFGKERKG